MRVGVMGVMTPGWVSEEVVEMQVFKNISQLCSGVSSLDVSSAAP